MNYIPTVLCYYDKIDSVCSFWRGHNPLSELSRQGLINIIQGNWGKDDWTTIRMADIAFFQRPMNKECFYQVAMCKDLGLKVWIDLDDHNEIPVYHEVYNLYTDIYDETEFTKIMMLADIVTVSTEYLKNHYLKYTSKKVVTVPNAINNYVFQFSKFSENKSIVYRGGNHHSVDLYEYREEIIDVMKQNPDYTLYTIGHDPKYLKTKLKNYEFLGNLSVHQYFAMIKTVNPSIFIVPLVDSEFNRAKSNISWIEGTMAGSVSLTPYWWGLGSCAAKYKSKTTFMDGFKSLINNRSLRLGYFEKSKELIFKKYFLSETNKMRMQIIKNLLK